MWYYRVRDGEVLGAGHSHHQGNDWIARYSAALGVDAASVEEFESEIDPRPLKARTEPQEESAAIVATPIEQIATALLADPNIAKETKAAIARIGIVSEPVPVAIAEVGSA